MGASWSIRRKRYEDKDPMGPFPRIIFDDKLDRESSWRLSFCEEW